LPKSFGKPFRAAVGLTGGMPGTRSALVLVDIFDRVADRRDLLAGVLGNLAPELFLESHDQLDDVEAVRAEIVDEARVFSDLVGFDAEVFDDDLFHPIGSLAHGETHSFLLSRCPSDALCGRQVRPSLRGAKRRSNPVERLDCFATLAMTMKQHRPLTAGEIEIARSVFGDAIDYTNVRLFKRKWWPFH